MALETLVFRTEIFPKPLTFADFDKNKLKKGHRKVGKAVVRIARRLVSARGVSSPGAYPGLATGLLRRSIKDKPSQSGFSTAVKPYKIAGMHDFYPAYVVYGHRGPGSTANDPRAHRKKVGKKVAAPRKNFIIEAAKMYGIERYGAEMKTLLADAIKPGVIGGGL